MLSIRTNPSPGKQEEGVHWNPIPQLAAVSLETSRRTCLSGGIVNIYPTFHRKHRPREHGNYRSRNCHPSSGRSTFPPRLEKHAASALYGRRTREPAVQGAHTTGEQHDLCLPALLENARKSKSSTTQPTDFGYYNCTFGTPKERFNAPAINRSRSVQLSRKTQKGAISTPRSTRTPESARSEQDPGRPLNLKHNATKRHFNMLVQVPLLQRRISMTFPFASTIVT